MILIEGFRKRFDAVTAVEDLSLQIEPGRITALLGPNGSGKSTTLKAFVGLVRPTAGRITIDGLRIDEQHEAALARTSFLPQALAFPDSMTGREVLRFFANLRGLQASVLPNAVALAGLNGAIDRPTGEYSGGMTQRLGLAVLSLPDAPILLLDEPASGLDPQGTRRFHDWLRSERDRGKTIVFTTHRLEDAEDLAERVLILVKGRLVADLTPSEVRVREAVEVRLSISNWRDDFQRITTEMHGEVLESDGEGELVFAAPALKAIDIMDRLRRDGADIVRFDSRSSLERFYHQITLEMSRE